MKERPILFSAPMVQAILDGRKTQTRRMMKPQPVQFNNTHWPVTHGWKEALLGGWQVTWNQHDMSATDAIAHYCPYGVPGDRLWVRESFKFGRAPNDEPGQGIALFDNDANTAVPHPQMERSRYHWCRYYRLTPSIHMPRWACRLVLEVVAVRVERVQEISEEDALAEGMETIPVGTATWSNRQSFATLWDQINGRRAGGAWADNPWVWVVEFRRRSAGQEMRRVQP